MSMIYCLYDTGSGSLWRSETRCNVTYKRMKKPWAFLIFNTQSTFCRDTAKANCENKEIQKNWNDAVSVSLLPVQWIVNGMLTPWWSRSLRLRRVSNSSPACWLPGMWRFLCVKGWKESSGGFCPDSARHQELTGRFLHSSCHQRD